MTRGRVVKDDKNYYNNSINSIYHNKNRRNDSNQKYDYNYNIHNRRYDDKSEYLKFLKYKNTPPPQDLKPKKLKYDGYYNFNLYENNYYNRGGRINILTPTPFKNDQVLAGNNQINFNNNLNFNYNNQPLKINNNNNNYASKYPVQISYKKDNDKKLIEEKNNYGNISNNNNNYWNKFGNYNYCHNNYNNNYNNLKYDNNYPTWGNNNALSYRVINAEEFLTKNIYNNPEDKYYYIFLNYLVKILY